MKTSIKKKIIVLLSLYLVILLSPKVKSENKIDINHTEYYDYVSLDNRNVIIIENDNLKMIDTNTNDVYILDLRSKDCDFKVLDSYKIKSKVEMEEIINILLQYEKENPTRWNRSFISMLNEWQVHNICYNLGYDKDSTEHVDFDNDDENKYNSGILKRLLGN